MNTDFAPGTATLTYTFTGMGIATKEYAESPQHKAALERMNKPPEKPQ